VNDAKSTFGRLAVLFASLAITSIAGAVLIATLQNRLSENDRWQLGKSMLEMRVNGVEEFYTQAQALKRNYLNLNVWQGFHEVLYRDLVNPELVVFRFKLEDNAYVAFVFDKNDGPYRAIRLSRNSDFPNAYLEVSGNGEFSHKQPIEMDDLSSEWHEAQISFDSMSINVMVDNVSVLQLPFGVAHSQFLGFRSGRNRSYVDDVVIDSTNGAHITESFDNWRSVPAFFFALIVVFFFIETLVYRFSRLEHRKNTAFTLILVNGTAAICLLAYSVAHTLWISGRYPPPGPTAQTYVEIFANRTNDALSATYSLAEDDKRRVMLIGSSQTWGSGATIRSERFTDQLATKLNARLRGACEIEVLNAGVSAGNSKLLLNWYRETWIKYDPQIVVINLSNNDRDDTEFKANLSEFVSLNRGLGIKTLFSLEPNSIEQTPTELRLHSSMRQIATATETPIVNMHQLLKEHYDDGFLWWDRVHPTSYGHGLIAGYLLEPIASMLDMCVDSN
jgi:lysophospholipase L1-like esterase